MPAAAFTSFDFSCIYEKIFSFFFGFCSFSSLPYKVHTHTKYIYTFSGSTLNFYTRMRIPMVRQKTNDLSLTSISNFL